MTSWGGDAASQQTYFIVSGSLSNSMIEGGDQNIVLGMESPVGSSSHPNTMLGGGDQNTRLGMCSPVGLMLLHSKLILLSPAPHPKQC